MPPLEKLAVPFLTRDMLAFEQGVAFSLFVSIQSRVASRVSIRGITSEGIFSFNATPTADSARTNFTFRIPNIPIFLNVTDGDDDFKQGDCYVVISLLAEGELIQQLAAGYVYGLKAITYPGNTIDDQRIGGGKILDTESADPAAGAECTLTVPAGQTWRFIAAKLNLVADGTATDRRVILKFTLAGGVVLRCFMGTNQTASQNINYSCADFGATASPMNDNTWQIATPSNLLLLPGDIIETETVNLQAGDNYGKMEVRVEQFFETS